MNTFCSQVITFFSLKKADFATATARFPGCCCQNGWVPRCEIHPKSPLCHARWAFQYIFIYFESWLLPGKENTVLVSRNTVRTAERHKKTPKAQKLSGLTSCTPFAVILDRQQALFQIFFHFADFNFCRFAVFASFGLDAKRFFDCC